ncbi:peptide ABC transporter substrate-binding protein [Cohnella lubricantis]|uniref:Peptide ABC transporter substrate-binding protein n=1 Tax=Cohnella lubricantis TaxID=2163172 RepID=A0A841TED2_9BACL|nr:peptide ABC transporter substrate-binding protein [Cohnella lubricantis]MBB6677337.1 peptide ABC transporter substrate-binding protein [Cohnella lubricantis]MBP2116851.1 oligopeptide transport system substrate-binding protein [Cohnella lubricantis]
MRKTWLSILALLLVTGVLLAGCGTKNASGPGIFNMNLSSDPPSLDPALAQDSVSFVVLTGLYEGLTRKDAEGNTIPGVAEKWDISGDKKTYTFHLRHDAKWSNGDPVTAHDFEYAWKRVLDPNLNPASPYAYQLYYIKNAQNYNMAADNPDHISDPNQVGVKALDDYTLQVELENPTPYFLSITSFWTLFPVHQSAKSNPAWASKAETMITNGAFKMASWKHGNAIDLVPNENYYAKGEVKLKKVHFYMVNNASTEMMMFHTGQLSFAGFPTGEIPAEQIGKLKEINKDELHIQPTAGTYYYAFNLTKQPFDNLNIRKALTMAIDRQLIVDKVTKGGQVPAYGFVPPSIQGDGQMFREQYPDTGLLSEDIAQAKQLLAQGLKEEGLASFPPVTLTINDGAGHKQVAEALADMWRKNLGIEVQIQTQEWKVFLQNRTSLNYDIARAGWSADYNDPMTFIDMYTSTSGNNDLGFKNPQYDALVKQAYASSDQQQRMQLMDQAEQILVKDNMAILPVYYYSGVYMVQQNVQGLEMDYQGQIDFTRASVQ